MTSSPRTPTRGKKRSLATERPRPRPLIARPGARFRCFGDGLCCTDIHALGPITRSEARDMRAIDPAGVFMNHDVDDLCLRPVEGGGCYFQRDGMCQVHAQHGAEAKPTGCQRFPFGLVSTPHGGRVTTESRCPCRTLGERPPLDLTEAERSLRDRAGRLEVDQEVPARIPVTHARRVRFEAYLAVEGELLQALARGDAPEQVLRATAFPDLAERSWPGYAGEYFDMSDGTAGGEALAWFGDGLLELASRHRPPPRTRPWSDAFARAIARTKTPQDPAAMYADWIADELWLMRWLGWDVSFDVGRAELATRLTVARHLQKKLQRSARLRPDQAVAEAIMMVELAAASSEWPGTVEAIATDPSPAEALF